MRPIATLMGSLLLAGNLLLALPVRQNVLVVRNAEQAEREIRREMSAYLVSRGLEPESALRTVERHFDAGAKQAAVHVHFFTAIFPEVSREALLRYGAQRALRGETFDLRSYDHMTAMLQQLLGPALSDSLRRRIGQCVMLNRSIG